jgi:hypothetical protein
MGAVNYGWWHGWDVEVHSVTQWCRDLTGCTPAVWIKLLKKGTQHYAAQMELTLDLMTGFIPHSNVFTNTVQPPLHLSCTVWPTCSRLFNSSKLIAIANMENFGLPHTGQWILSSDLLTRTPWVNPCLPPHHLLCVPKSDISNKCVWFLWLVRQHNRAFCQWLNNHP